MKISDYLKKRYGDYFEQFTEDYLYEDEDLNLSPCPRCGNKAKLDFCSGGEGIRGYKGVFVKCTNCLIRTESIVINGYYGEKTTINDAIREWNYNEK